MRSTGRKGGRKGGSFSMALLVGGILLLGGCGAKKELRSLPDIPAPKLTYEEGSIWPKEATGLLLFKDTKAKKVGDIITVHIIEKVKAENGSTTDTDRENNFKLGTLFGSSRANYNLGGSDELKSRGRTTRKGSLKTTLTAMVVEVFPNGNLRIDGAKDLTVNGDEQSVRIEGIVRPEDISRSNSVLSTHIAEATISYKGEGVLAKNENRGWAGKLLRVIWPF